MTTAAERRVKITRDITYAPPGKLPAWYRHFKKDWEGVVPLVQFEFLVAKNACHAMVGDVGDVAAGAAVAEEDGAAG